MAWNWNWRDGGKSGEIAISFFQGTEELVGLLHCCGGEELLVGAEPAQTAPSEGMWQARRQVIFK